MASREEIKAIWKFADCVCFDVDSTVCRDEGIDDLGDFCGKGDDVAKITNEAMSGKMNYNESLKLRLGIINPSSSDVKEFVETRPPRLTPGIRELVRALQLKGVPIYLISGGFHCLIEPMALELGIPFDRVYANRLKFFFDGKYAGLDDNEPTARGEGKREVIKHLKASFGYRAVVMIGDGFTDLQTAPPANAFIGFGGNVVREEVRSKSKWFVTHFQDLLEELY